MRETGSAIAGMNEANSQMTDETAVVSLVCFIAGLLLKGEITDVADRADCGENFRDFSWVDLPPPLHVLELFTFLKSEPILYVNKYGLFVKLLNYKFS